MKVRQIMHKEVISVLPDATLHDAALRMKENRVGSVLVLEDGGRLRGIVTDRDISLAVAADFKDPLRTLASDVMAMEPVTIQSGADVDYALKVMHDQNVRRLPVCDRDKVIGILTSADVAAEIKEEFNQFLGLEEAFSKLH